MNPMYAQLIDALLRSSVLLAVAWTAYRFLLRNTRWFGLNRMVLLGIALGSAVLPWLPVGQWFQDGLQQGLQLGMNLLSGAAGASSAASGEATEVRSTLTLPTVYANADVGGNWLALLVSIWALGAAFFAGLFLRDLNKVFARLRATQPATLMGQTVRLSRGNDSFSFGRTVVIGQRDAEDPERLAAVLAHERAHSQQGHSIDVLLAEALRVLLWFNPVAWMLRRDIAENAEFLADRAAVAATQTTNADASEGPYADLPYAKGALPYARRLIEHQLANLQGGSTRQAAEPAPGLVHAFHQHQLKRRIAMLTHTQTPRARLLRYAVVLAIASTAIAACASEPEADITAIVAQTNNSGLDSIYLQADEPAAYVGGMEAMIQHLTKEIKYPASAKSAGIQGKAFVQFVVDPEGRVVRTELVKGFDPACDAEALRVVEAMPDWTPAVKDGENVAMQLVLPIAFQLPAAE